MFPKAERPLRQTHPIVFCYVPSLPPHPRSSGPQRRDPPTPSPLWKRDAFSSTHEFIQLMSKAKNPLPSHSTKPRKGATGGKKEDGKNKSGPVKNQKGISHIRLVSVHSIQHTFWPSCGLKKKRKESLRWHGSDRTSRQIMRTFAHECWRRRWRWRAKKRRLVWDWELRPRWRKHEMAHLMSAKSPMFLISQRLQREGRERERRAVVKL